MTTAVEQPSRADPIGVRQRIANVLGRFPTDRAWLLGWPVVLILLGYAGIFLHKSILDLDRQLPQLRAEASLVTTQASEVRQLQLAGARKRLSDPLAAKEAVLAALRSAQIEKDSTKLDAPAAGQINASLSSVKFDLWIQTVENLFNESGIVLTTAQLTQLSPGFVRVEATFTY